jgi:hypothetical protein
MRVPTLLESTVLAALLAPGLLPLTATAVEHHRFPMSAPLVVLRAGTPWNNLSPGEQEVLQKHRHDWGGYPPERQDRLRDGAQRYLNLPQDKRDKIKRKQKQYREMSPEERKRLREQYRRQKEHR